MYDPLSLVLIGSFFLISIMIGIISSRKSDAEGFFIANRTLGLFQSVMTVSGTFIGAMFLMVYTAFVFTFGISAFWILIGYFVGFVLFTYFGIYLFNYSKGKDFYTLADYFKYRYGRKVALVIVIILFIWYFGTLSAQFIGGGKVLSEVTGISFSISAIAMCALIIAYLILGGFRSVVKTDVFQFFVFGLVLFVIGLTIKTGLKIPPGHLNPFNAGIGNILAFFLSGVLTPFATQDYWQRILAMKDEKVVKRAFVLSGTIVLIISLVLTYIGLVARTNFSDIDADLAVLHSFIELVPGFMIGFVAIAFFAAILSTADTFLFMLSINFTNDIMEMKNADPKRKIRMTRIAIFCIGSLALILALLYPNIVDISIVFRSIGLVIAPIVIICWFWKGDDTAIISTIITSTSLVLLLSLIGFIRPELGFVGMIGGFLIYYLITQLMRLSRSHQKHPPENAKK